MIKLSIVTANRPYVAVVALIAVAQIAVEHIRAPRAGRTVLSTRPVEAGLHSLKRISFRPLRIPHCINQCRVIIIWTHKRFPLCFGGKPPISR